jgi:hypothetical protein
MEIDESASHLEKAEASIWDSLEPDSNVTSESDSHSEKQRQASVSTEEAMQIDERDAHGENADSSIHES